jgi:hypothetical protein
MACRWDTVSIESVRAICSSVLALCFAYDRQDVRSPTGGAVCALGSRKDLRVRW